MKYDFAIIGAGIAGASLAAELAPLGSVLLLEAEDQPGYHSTGRSAAFWDETYGGPAIQPLTTASHSHLDQGFLKPLGGLYVGRADERPLIERFLSNFEGTGVALQRVSTEDLAASIPGLKPAWSEAAMLATCADIDVGGLHNSYLSAARRHGAHQVVRARVCALAWRGCGWEIESSAGNFEAAKLINAAGAWADDVAALAGVKPMGIQPFQRTVVQLRTSPAPPEALPHVMHIGGKFYVKPEAGGRLWLSPHDETPVDAGDVAPEELDVAIAIDQFEQLVDWKIEAVERKWAGLRSFAPDRLPVFGFDLANESFFWCAAQGGFGIQTAPAAAKICLSLLTGQTPDPSVAGIDPAPYAPGRFA